jgi:hypothetical protein
MRTTATSQLGSTTGRSGTLAGQSRARGAVVSATNVQSDNFIPW